jgi:hypothetical protein
MYTDAQNSVTTLREAMMNDAIDIAMASASTHNNNAFHGIVLQWCGLVATDDQPSLYNLLA